MKIPFLINYVRNILENSQQFIKNSLPFGYKTFKGGLNSIKNNALDTEQDASKEKGEILYKDVIQKYSKLITEMLGE